MMNEFMMKMILDATKAHVANHAENSYSESDKEFWMQFKGLKLVEVTRADDPSMKHGGCEHNNVICETSYKHNDMNTCIMKLEAKFTFKAKKYENNIMFMQVNIYSDGGLGLYFDGTAYEG